MAPAITDVPGVLIGHAHDPAALTGCTVVLTPTGAVGGVDVRGGGPATRETALLDPTANVAVVHAIALCGGSAFGLAAATGVMEWLQERNIGYETRVRRVPIVPAAAIFDLGLGRSDRWPDAAMGYAACDAATPVTAEGCVGAGMGATVGKVMGIAHAVKSGVGTWSERLADGATIGALAVCNAWGDVYHAASGSILAGARDASQNGAFAGAMALLRQLPVQEALRARLESQNTTLAVVATDVQLSKAEANRLAQMAQAALPRTIRPIYTPFDGDTVFALSTNARPRHHLAVLGAIAADVLARAIERCVLTATAAGGLPAARDLGALGKCGWGV